MMRQETSADWPCVTKNKLLSLATVVVSCAQRKECCDETALKEVVLWR